MFDTDGKCTALGGVCEAAIGGNDTGPLPELEKLVFGAVVST